MMTITEVGDPNVMRSEIDPDSGSLICFRDFDVQRSAASSTHRVSIEIGEDGFPQTETCDCSGFRFRGACSHIAAVDEVLTVEATIE